MSRADEIAQGLRLPSGELIGGLDVIEYTRGFADFDAGTAPPSGLTSTSYDLGRAGARERAEARATMLAEIEERDRKSRAAIREMLKERPDILADYDAKMAALGVRGP